MTLPRLTGTLRTYGGVTRTTNSEQDEENEISLIDKGRRQMVRKAEKGLTWRRLETSIQKKSDNGGATKKLLRDIINCASGLGRCQLLTFSCVVE